MEQLRQYLYQLPDWPQFSWDPSALLEPLMSVRQRQAELLGLMHQLGFEAREQQSMESLALEIVKSSEIENEVLSLKQVRSSLANHLGLTTAGPIDRHIDGYVEVILDATSAAHADLTEDRLFGWHSLLFPGGWSGRRRIRVGEWRTVEDDPMRVISAKRLETIVHFEALSGAHVPREMTHFLEWVNHPSDQDPVLRAAIAHLWFVTIHPFEDGNGRLARVITEMMLTRADGSTQRFYSMSAQVRKEREKGYYATLEQVQSGTMDVTVWLRWFLACLDRALDSTKSVRDRVLRKALFWETHREADLNARQLKVVNRMLDGLIRDPMTTKLWSTLTDRSKDTAERDVQDLIRKGILARSAAGGRSTHYTLVGLSDDWSPIVSPDDERE